MTTELHYSPIALMRRTAWMAIAAAVVIIDFVAHANGGFPRVFGLGFVPSATLIATALYLVGVTAVLTLGLIQHGGVALAASNSGLTVHTAWFSKTLAWGDLARIGLEVRLTKYSHYTVVAIHETSGVVRCHAVDSRLLAERLDQVSTWVDSVERDRVARGGAPYTAPTTGLAGYNARNTAAEITADIAASKASGVI